MSVEYDALLNAFLHDHPEHAGGRRMAKLPDGTTELCLTADAMDAFLRWCLINGHGDPRKIIDLLADVMPQLKARSRAFKEAKRASANGTEPRSDDTAPS